ncbi:hypothetical protein [Vibrio cincinnatiensis]|uniref:hypothetical protein n=1 Tax=Vibrio cincinnatiensis TaxID=675 RepID=UPI0013028BFB|nr:hypothetical protein [Vibrio cincinnatiensis]
MFRDLDDYYDYLNHNIIYKRFFDSYSDKEEFDQLLFAIRLKKLAVFAHQIGLELYNFELKPYVEDTYQPTNIFKFEHALMVCAMEYAKLKNWKLAERYAIQIADLHLMNRTKNMILYLDIQPSEK